MNDPRNLGGPLPSFQFDALTLELNCALRPLASLALDDESRGIHMAKARTFLTADAGITLTLKTLKERITYGNGVVVKDGAGDSVRPVPPHARCQPLPSMPDFKNLVTCLKRTTGKPAAAPRVLLQ